MNKLLVENKFENAYEFYDVCPKCNKESYDYKVITENNKQIYQCPKCGHIN